MKELQLSDNFALIGLQGQDSERLTNSKRISLRSMVAAVILELYMNEKLNPAKNSVTLENEPDYVRGILAMFKDANENDLSAYLHEINRFSNKKLLKVEALFVAHLQTAKLLVEKNSLLSCDLEFETAGIIAKEYVVDEKFYHQIIEEFRAEILEMGVRTDECLILLWLCKESGCLHDLFSKNELIIVMEQYERLLLENTFAKSFYHLSIYRTKEHFIKQFFKKKTEIISTAEGSGLNFIFPIIERSQAVFIDIESYFSNADDRFTVVKERLNKYNIDYEVKTSGDVPLLKIGGFLYEAVPFTKQYRMPVHGVQLRKYPLA